MIVHIHHTAADLIDAANARDPDFPGRSAGFSRLVRGANHVNDRAELLRIRGALLMLAGLVLTIPSAGILAVRGSPFWILPLVLAVVLALAVLRGFFRVGSNRRIERMFERDPHHSDAATVEVNDIGMKFTAPRRQVSVDWTAIKKFWETPTVMLLTDDEPLTFVIPKRCFESDSAMQTFRSIVRKHLKQSRSDL